MKALFILSLIVSSSVHAFAEMKAGLWKVTTIQKVDGKVVETDVNKMMTSLNAEQKKKLKESQEKMGITLNKDGSVNTCFTVQKFKEMSTPRKDCKNEVIQQSPVKSITTFKCKDGTTGEITQTMNSSEAFTSDSLVINPDKTTVNVEAKGTFVKADCGKLE